MSICDEEGKGPATLFDMFETMQEGCQQQSGGRGGEPEVSRRSRVAQKRKLRAIACPAIPNQTVNEELTS